MRKTQKSLLPLHDVFIIGACAAAAAFFGHAPLAKILTIAENIFIPYTLAFLAVFIPLVMMDRVIRRNKGPKTDFGGRMARIVLTVLIFAIPLYILTQQKITAPSLKKIMEQEQPAPTEKELGYEETDREKLDALIEGETP